MQRIVIGVDGSPGSLAAVELVAQLSSRLRVPVTAVPVYEPLMERSIRNDATDWHDRMEQVVRAWTAPVERAGSPCQIEVDRDIHPVAAIARVLEAQPGSVAVVGACGIGGFTGQRVGRVPLQLVHHTGAAVVLVPATSDE